MKQEHQDELEMRWQSPCNCYAEPKRIQNVIKTWKDGYGRVRETKEIYFVYSLCGTKGSVVCEFNITSDN